MAHSCRVGVQLGTRGSACAPGAPDAGKFPPSRACFSLLCTRCLGYYDRGMFGSAGVVLMDSQLILAHPCPRARNVSGYSHHFIPVETLARATSYHSEY